MSETARLSLQPITHDSAGGAAKETLGRVVEQMGFVPNMYANMANSPAVLDTYLFGYQRFRETSGLTPPEQEVVFLVISFENGCDYLRAAPSAGHHSGIGGQDLEQLLQPCVRHAARCAVRLVRVDRCASVRCARWSARGQAQDHRRPRPAMRGQ